MAGTRSGVQFSLAPQLPQFRELNGSARREPCHRDGHILVTTGRGFPAYRRRRSRSHRVSIVVQADGVDERPVVDCVFACSRSHTRLLHVTTGRSTRSHQTTACDAGSARHMPLSTTLVTLPTWPVTPTPSSRTSRPSHLGSTFGEQRCRSFCSAILWGWSRTQAGPLSSPARGRALVPPSLAGSVRVERR